MGKMDAAEEVGRRRPRSSPEVGRRISELCEQIGNRTKAAAAAGISADQLLRIIRGRSEPSLITITRLAEAAGVSLDWVAYGDEEAQSSGEKEVAPLDTDVLQGAIEAVRQELEGRKVHLPPDKQAVLISEIYAHLREEKLHGPQNADHIIRLIRSMVKVAS